jgi:hypothetical protein
MPMKPIPLAAYLPDFVPPVTGFNGNPAPVANTFDSTGLFAGCGRSGSVKRRREDEEIDRVFDRSALYPPVTAPSRPTFDLEGVKTLLVAASAAGEEVRPLLDAADLDPKIKAVGCLTIALLDVVAGVVEKVLTPLPGPGLGHGAGSAKPPNSPLPPPPPQKALGIKELRECLERADKESVLFDADLGPNPMGNRSGLASALSAGIRNAAINNAKEKGLDPAEAVRSMDDALGCATDMDFIGIRSEKPKNRSDTGSENPAGEKNYCSMPVKFRFEDRNTRMHFERTVKQQCNLRAVMSLPKPLREEQSVIARQLRERYPGRIVTVRPDLTTLHFIAFHKGDKEKRWNRCVESVPIPPAILLPGYNIRKVIPLPPVVVAVEGPAQDTGSASTATDSSIIAIASSQESSQNMES